MESLGRSWLVLKRLVSLLLGLQFWVPAFPRLHQRPFPKLALQGPARRDQAKRPAAATFRSKGGSQRLDRELWDLQVPLLLRPSKRRVKIRQHLQVQIHRFQRMEQQLWVTLPILLMLRNLLTQLMSPKHPEKGETMGKARASPSRRSWNFSRF